MSTLYARLINQYKYNYQTVFSARFDEQDEHGGLLDQIELQIKLNNNHNLTESDFDKFIVSFQLEDRIQLQESEDSGCRFVKDNSMRIYIFKTTEMDGSTFLKILLRSSAILSIENDDKFCFLWSILASLHPFEDSHPDIVSIFRQYFNELNIQGFDFTNRFNCSDVNKFEKLNNLSINIFELIFLSRSN